MVDSAKPSSTGHELVSDPDVNSILLVSERPAAGEPITGQKIVFEGYAIASAEIEEIVITVGDIVQHAAFGIYREDLAKTYSTLPMVANSGFFCEFDREQLASLPASATSDGLQLSIVARDRRGREKRLHSKLVFSPIEAVQARAKLDSPVEPVFLLQVDEISVDRRGLLRVQGWAVSHSPIDAISIYIGSEFIGFADIGIDRQDVAQALPESSTAGKSGFLLLTDATRLIPDGQQNASQHQLRIVAKSAAGDSSEKNSLLQLPSHAARRKPKEVEELFCDFVTLTKSGQLSLSGWAVSHLGIDKIRIYFEGEVVGLADHGRHRPDIGNKYPFVVHSRKAGFGFRTDLDRSKIGDEHTVCVEVVSLDGSSRRNNIVVVTKAVAEPELLIAPDTPADEIRLHIDEPEIVGGKVTRRIEATFVISGWAIAESGFASIDFALDGKPIGTAYYGIRREDVAEAFPNYGGDTALLSGFAFSLPHRFLVEGTHEVTVRATTRRNVEKTLQFQIEIGAIGEQPGPWILREALPATEVLFAQQIIDRLQFRPKIYVWLNCARNRTEYLLQTMKSVAGQSYQDWTVVITGDAEVRPTIDRILRDQLPEIGTRIICFPKGDEIEELIAAARPRDLVLPLDVGDILSADALFEFAVMLNHNNQIDFIYGDERKLNVGNNREEAFFKPDWSPTLLLSTNYIGRPWCASVERFHKTRRKIFGNSTGNFDAVLQLTESASEVAHIQRVLARRPDSSLETQEIEIRALKSALKRRRMPSTVIQGLVKNSYRCCPKATVHDKERVSIIIPTCATRGLIKICLESLRGISTYKNFEIICIENIADKDSAWKQWLRDNCDVVIEIDEAFNWSLFNNLAVQEASGSYLLFLNDDIEVIEPDWLVTMLDLARSDDVGVVGPQLLYPDRKVQHAGMFLADGGIARHAFRFCSEDDPGYFGLALTQRDVIAVTGACMLMKKSTFETIGGFDESHSIINNDLDFCLKTHEQNLRCIYTPFARLIHHELASRKDIRDIHDVDAFNLRWSTLFASGDPFFHPALDKNGDMYSVDHEPTELLFAGNPLFDQQAVKRILAIKVDHIGDFITAFPAFRRIKLHFPDAELIALVAPASQQLAGLEPAIDRTIPFEFFHARSQLGQAEVSKERLEELSRELAAYGFDIAIDLRKQSDTRDLLKLAGARVAAGFDHRHEHAWLDVALTFEGDAALTNKRQHVSGDLLNLVDATAAAGLRDRTIIKHSGDRSARQMPVVTRVAAIGLYVKRVVCIHPAAGNAIKQWPIAYFVDLIRMLMTENVNFAIIGGPDEAEFANGLVEPFSETGRVFNLVGKLRLDELSYFLDSCSLFVGNDSGPKHIASGLGVPTVGIQSGVVDAQEWGPLGEIAVMARRNMSCSPCYRARVELCHRGLACLHGLQPGSIAGICRTLLKLERGIRIT